MSVVPVETAFAVVAPAVLRGGHTAEESCAWQVRQRYHRGTRVSVVPLKKACAVEMHWLSPWEVRLRGTQRERVQRWRQPFCAAATLQRSHARGKCASAITGARV